MQVFLVLIASVLAFVGNIPYLYDIVRGKIQPHPFTWFVWSIVSCITFFGALQKGGGLGTIPIFVSEIFTIIIFLLALIFSFRNKLYHINKIDLIYLALCLFGLIPWYLTSDPTISVCIAVLIDLIAFLPTIRKTYFHPESENSILYAMNFSRHVLILFSLDTYNIATTLHSIAMIISNSLMTYLILFRKSINKYFFGKF